MTWYAAWSGMNSMNMVRACALSARSNIMSCKSITLGTLDMRKHSILVVEHIIDLRRNNIVAKIS